MLLLQVKVSKKGGIVVIDPTGEMHPCIEPGDLWDTMKTLVASSPPGSHTPVSDALFVQVKIRRNAIVVIDPLAEMHHCSDGHELWEAIADIIENEDIPPATITALAMQAPNDLEEAEHVQVIRDNSPHDHVDEVRSVIEEMVGDAAANLGSSLFKRLRGMSHRGAAPKPGSRRPRRKVKRGDIY